MRGDIRASDENSEILLDFIVPVDPESSGAISGQLIILSNDTDQPNTQLAITGMAQTAPQIAIDTTGINLGNVPVSAPDTDNALTLQQTLTIKNTGQATLHVSRIELHNLNNQLNLDEVSSFMVPDQRRGWSARYLF